MLSAGLEDVNDAAGDHVAGLGGVSGHMWGRSVRLQRFGALPFLDHDESIRAKFRLEITNALGIDRRPVFDTAFLTVNRRHVGVEFLQDRLTHAGFGGDDRNDMNHVFPLKRCVRKRCGVGSSIAGGFWSPSRHRLPPLPTQHFSARQASLARKSSSIAASPVRSNAPAYSAPQSGHQVLCTASENARYRK